MHYEPGKWIVRCDRCGFQRMNDQVVKSWDELLVCKPTIKPGCFETRHPLDLIRAKPEDVSVPFTRGPEIVTYVTVSYVDPSVGTQETTIPAGTSGNGTTI